VVSAGDAAVVHSRPPTDSGPTVDDAAVGHLRGLAVSDADFYRPVLYTWTPASSIAPLRTSRELLTATATTGTFVSPFNRALAQIAASPGSGQAIARLLTTDPRLMRRRYAWPAPFATVMGLGNRTYGTSLVRIELSPQAWIARFDPAAREPFTVIDAAGAAVATAEVLAAPERLGAIFHVRTDAWQGHRFREYVVCSPAMVASWSIATADIAAELAAERAMVAALVAEFARLPRRDRDARPTETWARGPRTDHAIEHWRAALAFDNDRYRADPERLRSIITALDAYDPAGESLSVTP
jgi:hypothetical protein